MIKRFILLFALFPTLSFAAGPYDGIWQTNEGDFYSLHENDAGAMIMLEFDANDLDVVALIGTQKNSNADLSLALGAGYIRINLIFDSSTSLSIRILECTNVFGNPCFNPTLLPLNTGTATKVF